MRNEVFFLSILISLSATFPGVVLAKEKTSTVKSKQLEARELRRLKRRVRSFYETQIKDLEFEERRLKGVEAVRKKRQEELQRREAARLKHIESRSTYANKEETPAYQKHLENEQAYADEQAERQQRFKQLQSKLEAAIKKKSFSEEEEYGLEAPPRDIQSDEPGDAPESEESK